MWFLSPPSHRWGLGGTGGSLLFLSTHALIFWLQAPGDWAGHTFDLCRYGSCCLSFPFFFFPLSWLKALLFPALKMTFYGNQGCSPQFLYCTSLLLLQSWEKAVSPWQTARWLCDLCKLKFCTNSLIYTRWKTQPQGCYKLCCWSRGRALCQLGSRWSVPCTGPQEGGKWSLCTCQKSCSRERCSAAQHS